MHIRLPATLGGAIAICSNNHAAVTMVTLGRQGEEAKQKCTEWK